MTPKPIAVVYVPQSAYGAGGRKLSWSDSHEIKQTFEKEMPDYYWLVLLDYDAPKIELKVFYEKDFTPIQYEELKSLIANAIEQTKNTQP